MIIIKGIDMESRIIQRLIAAKVDPKTADFPYELIDPITYELLIDPVIASDGHVYNRSTVNFFKGKPSPMVPTCKVFHILKDSEHATILVEQEVKKREQQAAHQSGQSQEDKTSIPATPKKKVERAGMTWGYIYKLGKTIEGSDAATLSEAMYGVAKENGPDALWHLIELGLVKSHEDLKKLFTYFALDRKISEYEELDAPKERPYPTSLVNPRLYSMFPPQHYKRFPAKLYGIARNDLLEFASHMPFQLCIKLQNFLLPAQTLVPHEECMFFLPSSPMHFFRKLGEAGIPLAKLLNTFHHLNENELLATLCKLAKYDNPFAVNEEFDSSEKHAPYSGGETTNLCA